MQLTFQMFCALLTFAAILVFVLAPVFFCVAGQYSAHSQMKLIGLKEDPQLPGLLRLSAVQEFLNATKWVAALFALILVFLEFSLLGSEVSSDGAIIGAALSIIIAFVWSFMCARGWNHAVAKEIAHRRELSGYQKFLGTITGIRNENEHGTCRVELELCDRQGPLSLLAPEWRMKQIKEWYARAPNQPLLFFAQLMGKEQVLGTQYVYAPRAAKQSVNHTAEHYETPAGC